MSKLTHKINLKNLKWKELLGGIALLIFGLVVGGGFGINMSPEGEVTIETDYAIELSEDQVPALVENSDGVIEEISAPTVEMIDSGQAFDDEEIPDFGEGAWRDMSSPDAYKNAVIGLHIDFDGKHGEQCVDLFAEFHHNYTGRWLSTAGTGAAYGLWDARDTNAGEDYELITDPTQIQPGDWIVTAGGQYGHTGMAVGYYNNGYVALLGENQGGAPGVNGGAATNIINMGLKTFRGAFRPKMWVKAEPEPEPELPIPISGCVQWHVLRGDTMSKIMLECEKTVVYGEAMDAYAKTWYSMVYNPGQSVYDGWHSQSGVGLYAGDDIEHRTE